MSSFDGGDINNLRGAGISSNMILIKINKLGNKPVRDEGIKDDQLVLSTEAGIIYLHNHCPNSELFSGARSVIDDRVILSLEAGIIFLHMHRCCPYMELQSGTTIFGIKFKNGIMLVADGFAFKTGDTSNKPFDTRRLKIEEIGDPIYMLAGASGDNVWYEPLLDSMIEEMGGNRWKAMRCGEHAKKFLNQKDYKPPGNYDVKDMNLSQHSCRLLFAAWEPKDNEDPNVLYPVLVRASREKVESVRNVCCIGSGESVAQMLEGKDFSNSEKQEVIPFVERAMIDISKKDPRNGGDINIGHIDSSNVVTFEPTKSVTLLELEHAFRAGMGASSNPKRRRKEDTKSAQKKSKKK